MKAFYSPMTSMSLNAGSLGTLKKTTGKGKIKGCPADKQRKKFDQRLEKALGELCGFFTGMQKVSR